MVVDFLKRLGEQQRRLKSDRDARCPIGLRRNDVREPTKVDWPSPDEDPQ